jgi:hypothetical protein
VFKMNRFRFLSLAAFSALAVTAAAQAPALEAGLDPAVDARVKSDLDTIRKADANRKTAFLTWGSPKAERYQILQQFRDTRVKASMDAVEALVPFRTSMPKDQWKTVVSHVAAQTPEPLLAEKALKELPAVVPDGTRRKPAEKALKDLVSAVEKNEKEREKGRQKFFSLLEKPTSNREEFVSVLAKFGDAQADLDDKLVEASDALQQALTQTEWQELVRRVSPPQPGG